MLPSFSFYRQNFSQNYHSKNNSLFLSQRKFVLLTVFFFIDYTFPFHLLDNAIASTNNPSLYFRPTMKHSAMVTPFPKNFTLSLEQTRLLEIVLSSSESGTCHSPLILYALLSIFLSLFFFSPLLHLFHILFSPQLSLLSFPRSFYSQKKLIERYLTAGTNRKRKFEGRKRRGGCRDKILVKFLRSVLSLGISRRVE